MTTDAVIPICGERWRSPRCDAHAAAMMDVNHVCCGPMGHGHTCQCSCGATRFEDGLGID